MNGRPVCNVAALLAIFCAWTTFNARAGETSAQLEGAELAPEASVSLQTARAKALKARTGTISHEEIEKEAGGSGLRYSFAIKNAGKTYEVGIDAKTGEVLENIVESE